MDYLSLDPLGFLRLMQLADSALPIGSASHSFGLETLAVERDVSVEHLNTFLEHYLHECGTLEASFCCSSYILASRCEAEKFAEHLPALSMRLSAMKPARESRAASATLGRRFLQLAYSLHQEPLLRVALDTIKAHGDDIHASIAFGLVGSVLGIDERATVLAYLQQSITGLVSASQRLLPLGQQRARTLLWSLKPLLLTIAERGYTAAHTGQEVTYFTPLLDLGSMRHPSLETRLFIS